MGEMGGRWAVEWERKGVGVKSIVSLYSLGGQ